VVAARVLAVGADVKVRALIAVPPSALFNLTVASVAAAGEGHSVWVVKVVQHHHGAVLGAP